MLSWETGIHAVAWSGVTDAPDKPDMPKLRLVELRERGQ